MEVRIRPNVSFIKFLITIKTKKQLEAVLSTATTDQIKAVLEIIGNLISGNIAFHSVYIHKLKRFKDLLDNLWNSRDALAVKKTILCENLNALFLVFDAVKPFIRRIEDVI